MGTANLAKNLVVTPQPASVIRDITDAIARRLPVCVYKGGAFDGLLQDLYPQLPIKHPAVFGYDAIRSGACAAIVKDYSGWQVDKGQKKYNDECDLVVAG